MGSGLWNVDRFVDYSRRMGRSVSDKGDFTGNYTNQEMFKADRLDPMLDPKGVMRECRDTEEHPATIPVILALDVTGSMGQAAVEVAKQLNVIMTKLYERIKDVEFMVMGIGDLECDRVPIQISQFESDIRIADQLDRIFFEFGGGGNSYESYTAAWYMAARHTVLDCWARGKKGILITMGDEPLNPYLPLVGRKTGLLEVTGDKVKKDVETKLLYPEVCKRYDVYHLNVQHRRWLNPDIEKSFRKYLDADHYRDVTLNSITEEIIDIITGASEEHTEAAVVCAGKTETLEKAAGDEKKNHRFIFW